MQRQAVDPQQHPVDQYRNRWPDIAQYLALLYLFSKWPFYEGTPNEDSFNRAMNRYRDLELYCSEFEGLVTAFADPGDYGEVRGAMDLLHAAVISRMWKPMPTRRMFTALKDDLQNLTQLQRIKKIMRPLTMYFRANGDPNEDLELEIIDALSVLRNPRIRRLLAQVRSDLTAMAAEAEPGDPFVVPYDILQTLTSSD